MERRERELTVAVEPDLHHGCCHKTERRAISKKRKKQEPSFYILIINCVKSPYEASRLNQLFLFGLYLV